MISRALFYDMLDKAQLHSTYKELLSSISGPTKGLKCASRLVMERSRPPSPWGGRSRGGSQPRPPQGLNGAFSPHQS